VKSCLLVFRTSRIAGAERVGLDLAEGIKDKYRVEIGFLDRKVSTRFKNYPTRNWRSILFGRYDLIHSHLFLPGLLIRLRRLLGGRRFRWVHTVHYCSYEGQNWGGLKRFLDMRFIFPAADSLIAVSDETFELVKSFPNSRKIENGLDLKSLRLPHSRNPNLSCPVLGTVSMLRSEKGVAELITAMTDVLKKYEGAELRIAGDGPERDYLVSLIQKLGLSERVKLVGYVDDVENFLSSLDVFVSFAHTESFGIALLEAMQFSLPIIAMEVGAVGRLLGGGAYGVLMRQTFRFAGQFTGQSTGRDFTEQLSRVLAAPDLWQERSHQGLLFHQPQLGKAVMVDQYSSVYARLLRPGVCMVAPIVTHATGGLQRQIWLQSRKLSQLGYRVFILQRVDTEFSQKSSQWSHAEFLNTPNPFPNWRKDAELGHRLRGLSFVIVGFWRVFQHRREISVIHAHQLFSASVIGALAKKLLGTKVVVKVTASGALGELRELRRLPFYGLRKYAFRHIDQVIVLTEEMRAEMLELGFPDSFIRLIPNSVEVPNQTRKMGGISFKEGQESLNILYCGRLSREKSLDTLLKAGAKLVERGFPCSIDLVGGTYGGRDTTEELKELSRQLGPGLKVIFHGSQKEVARFYLSADAFVLPSVSEGMSNALLEALSYGIPCVTSDIFPNRAIIEHDSNGLLFKQGDANDLCVQLERLARDLKSRGELSYRLGSAAKKTVERRFSVDSIGRQLNELYRFLECGAEG
jgi:glycosyltransferase involved in cell wall biosynthesis